MYNTAWQNARRAAGLGDLHIHDLRHTAAVRLRESSVPERTITDVLWHGPHSITGHYARAQVAEILAALKLLSKPAENPQIYLWTSDQTDEGIS